MHKNFKTGVNMSIPPTHLNEINSSKPYQGHHREAFEVSINQKSKSIICRNFLEYSLQESFNQPSPIKDLKITSQQCFDRCMRNVQCKEFVELYLKQGFKFKS